VNLGAAAGKPVRARNHDPKRRVARFMASRTANAWDRTADGRSSVASELNAIFAALPRPAPAAEPAPSIPTAKPRRRRPHAGLITLALVALAALIASLLLLTPLVRHTPVRRAPPPQGARPVSPPPTPAPAPVLAAAPAATVPPAEAPPSPVQAGPPAPVPRRVAPRPAAQPARREAPPAAHHGRCPRFATEAWCLHGTIMAADDQLRDAYDAAVRAGVPRDIMVDVRSDWKKLRGRANRDPQALIRGYALLTQELRAEIRRRR
jgi:hypothetical protein